MKQLLLETNVTKLILDSVHDAMPYYEYCKATVLLLLLTSTGNAADLLFIRMTSLLTVMVSHYVQKVIK